MLNDFFEDQDTDSEEYLINKLKEYDLAYYEGSEPLLSDSEYDSFRTSIESKFPENEYFQGVGADIKFISSKNKKIKHKYILGSLKKFKEENVSKWLEKNSNKLVVITPKYDGLSVYCEIENEKLVLASTRGNGTEGFDITEKVKHFINLIPKDNITAKLRGEIILPGNFYEKLGMANRRNAASGIIGRDEITEDIKYLDIAFYELIDCSENFNSEYDKMCYIQKHFPRKTFPLSILNADQIHADYLIKTLEVWRKKLKDYCDIDGLVITLNDSERENVYYPENKIAFKHGDEEALAIVSNIKWETSRLGRVVPVVEFKDPVYLSGANVSQATAYNAKYILDNKIEPGTKVSIVRSGGTIPKITKVF